MHKWFAYLQILPMIAVIIASLNKTVEAVAEGVNGHKHLRVLNWYCDFERKTQSYPKYGPSVRSLTQLPVLFKCISAKYFTFR